MGELSPISPNHNQPIQLLSSYCISFSVSLCDLFFFLFCISFSSFFFFSVFFFLPPFLLFRFEEYALRSRKLETKSSSYTRKKVSSPKYANDRPHRHWGYSGLEAVTGSLSCKCLLFMQHTTITCQIWKEIIVIFEAGSTRIHSNMHEWGRGGRGEWRGEGEGGGNRMFTATVEFSKHNSSTCVNRSGLSHTTWRWTELSSLGHARK